MWEGNEFFQCSNFIDFVSRLDVSNTGDLYVLKGKGKLSERTYMDHWADALQRFQYK